MNDLLLVIRFLFLSDIFNPRKLILSSGVPLFKLNSPLVRQFNIKKTLT